MAGQSVSRNETYRRPIINQIQQTPFTIESVHYLLAIPYAEHRTTAVLKISEASIQQQGIQFPSNKIILVGLQHNSQ
jgi:hypothetical protein